MAGNTSDGYIIDSSYILTYVLPDEHSTSVDEIFSQYQAHNVHFHAPMLLRFEVCAGLWSATRQKRIHREVAGKLAESFLELGIVYHDVSYTDVLDLAIDSKLTVYDSVYLWLAREKKLPILTFDKQLARAAKSRLAA